MSLTWVLLPGLDGIGRFRTLRAALAGSVPVRALSYPTGVPLDYGALLALVESSLREEGPYCLVAESFSAPIAIRLAARRPSALRAVVFAAGFCACPLRGPLCGLLPLLPGPLLARAPSPWLVKGLFLGWRATPDLIADVQASARVLDPAVVVRRLAEIRRVDVCAELQKIPVPMLYLRARQDRIVGEHALRAMRRHAPQLEVVELDAPHMLLQTHPHAAIAAIRAFLARHGLEAPLV